MGLESYGVRLDALPELAISQLGSFLLERDFIEGYPSFLHSGDRFYERVGTDFIVEIVATTNVSSVEALEVSFAVCNPPSVDAFLLRLLKEFLQRFPSDVHIAEEKGFVRGNYTPGEHDCALRDIAGQIPKVRQLWQAVCGTRSGPARVSEAYSFCDRRFAR